MQKCQKQTHSISTVQALPFSACALLLCCPAVVDTNVQLLFAAALFLFGWMGEGGVFTAKLPQPVYIRSFCGRQAFSCPSNLPHPPRPAKKEQQQQAKVSRLGQMCKGCPVCHHPGHHHPRPGGRPGELFLCFNPDADRR